MTDAFNASFDRTNGKEGGYSNNPNDAGGETMWGITARVARANGYAGPMIELSLEEARRIAKIEYWDKLNLDRVALISYPVAEEMYDTRFNTGKCFLQRCLNTFNRQQKLYPDIKDDGQIGPATLAVLASYMLKRGKNAELVLMKALNCLQGAYYFDISDEGREVNEEFVYGWLDNRVGF